MKTVNDIGEFSSKYKAHERTKNLIQKQSRELSENLLKLNNTEVDGINQKENGFAVICTAGDKTYIACEGVFGRKMYEDIDFRNAAFENAQRIEPDIGSRFLTSIVKGQYGAGKSGVNTPQKLKRANYKGIGASQPKQKRKRNEEAAASSSSSTNNSDAGQSPWLRRMIQNQVASPKAKSKQPKKTAKQAFKFKCKYCNKKFKQELHLKSI